MIVYNNAFALGEAGLDKPRIGWQTYTRDAGVVVTVSTETSIGPKDAPLRPETWEYWEPTALPATWTLDLGSVKQVDYVGLAGHTIGSSGSTVKIETSIDNSVYTLFSAQVLPADDRAILFLDSQRSAKYVRVTLIGALAKLGVLNTGLILKMQKGVIGGY